MFYITRRLEVRPDARLVVLGDPHGDLAGVEMAFAREAGPATVELCVGDMVGHADGPTSSRLCDYLQGRSVASVQGNHEEWFLRAQELIFVEGRGANRKMTPGAISWVAGLPQRLDVVVSGSTEPVVSIVHSIRLPMWEEVDAASVGRLVRELPGVRLVVIGHSHCPRFLHHVPGSPAQVTPFPFAEVEEVARRLPEQGVLVVDAGSVSHPRAADPRARATHDFGTYAVVDLPSREVRLRRVDKRVAQKSSL